MCMMALKNLVLKVLTCADSENECVFGSSQPVAYILTCTVVFNIHKTDD